MIRVNLWNIFFVCMLLLANLCGCAQPPREEPQSEPGSEEPAPADAQDQETAQEMLSSFSVSGYGKGGRKQWDLEGRSANIETEKIKLKDVTGKVYGEDTNMTIVADKGSLSRINNNVQLEENVLATSDDGATLATDFLNWDAQNQKLLSDAPAHITRGKMEASGTGIVAQPVLKLIQLKKDVEVKLAMLETQLLPTVITSKGPLEVDYQANRAVFKDDVKVKDKRGEIFADKLDIYFVAQDKKNKDTQDEKEQDEKNKQTQDMEGLGIDKLIATGNVEIYRGDNITYSQKAVYDADTGELILTGRPKLVIYSTEDFSRLIETKEE